MLFVSRAVARSSVLVLLAVLSFSIALIAQSAAPQPTTKGPIAKLTATMDNVTGANTPVTVDILRWSTDEDRDRFVNAWNMVAPAGARGGARGARGGGRGGGRGAAPPPDGGRAGAPQGQADGGRGAGQAAEAGAAAAGGRGGDAAQADAAAAQADDAGRGGGGGGGRGGRGAALPPIPPTPRTPEAMLAAALLDAPSVGILWTSEHMGYGLRYAYRLPQPDGGERIIFATERRLGSSSELWQPQQPGNSPAYDFSVIEVRLNAKGEGEGRASLTGKITIDENKTIALENYENLPVVLKGVKRQ